MSGGITTACLQTAEDHEKLKLWAKGIPELSQALEADEGDPLRLLKSVYSLTTAPRSCVCRTLEELGAIQLKNDPCTWIVLDELQEIVGVISHPCR